MINNKIQHKYHLVNPSPWPFFCSIALFCVAIAFVMFMHNKSFAGILLTLSACGVVFVLFSWWQDVIKEGKDEKAHTNVVSSGLKYGVALFILSEIVFFAVFFASFFKASLDPVHILDNSLWPTLKSSWPPEGIATLDPWNIPFLNTLVLLLSGTTVTWAHYSLIENDQQNLIRALLITVLLGVFFTLLQIYEYHHATFKFKDGIYPSNFYMATGFHGFHVIVGTIFLFICYLRAKAGHFTKNLGHLGFEFAAWYWHFVDVVWLFLFTFVYVLGR